MGIQVIKYYYKYKLKTLKRNENPIRDSEDRRKSGQQHRDIP